MYKYTYFFMYVVDRKVDFFVISFGMYLFNFIIYFSMGEFFYWTRRMHFEIYQKRGTIFLPTIVQLSPFCLNHN